MILLPANADAAVVATPGISPATPLNVPYSIDGVYLNVLNGAFGSSAAAVGGWDLNPYGSTEMRWFSQSNVSGGSMLRYPSSATTTAGSLELGTLVGATGTYSTLVAAVTIGAGAGEWKLGAANYFGFRFVDDGDSLVHYGYGIMKLGDTAGSGSRTITNIFYETVAGQGIVVGAVPEPTSSLLAAGAAGLALLRRRRE